MPLFNFFKKYSFLIGIILFVFVIKDLNFSYYKKLLSEINIYYFLTGIILSPAVILIKSYRWKKICEAQKINYSMKKTFLIYGASLFLGLATPGRIGELSKIAYLKKDGHKISTSSLNSILDRVFDIIFLIIFSGIGFLIFPSLALKIAFKNIVTTFILSATLIIIGIILILKIKQKNYFKTFLKDMASDLKMLDVKSWILTTILTAISWSIYFFQIYLLAASVNIVQKVSFIYLSFMSAVNSFISMLPVSVLGIGTRDVTMIALLSPFGLPKEQIIFFSALIFLTYLPTAITGLISWYILNKNLTD